ncbi:hypothetical protein PT974_09304 [Cladobotryum mycophilum]|uniref:LYC1 C-terminal domain-containing protein n=1 Tax=Cladobotryum mycophilum TaxID=491253 RepID=A0ABR0SFT9_9HYPO
MSQINEEDLVYERAMGAKIGQTYENNGQIWSTPLALKDYVYIQYTLSNLDLTRNQVAWWVLYSRKNPETIISSCTTYLRDVVISNEDGAKPAKAVVVADIFTLPEYRMQGMATRLIRHLQWTLDEKKDYAVQFSVAYSSGHASFLENLGWKPYPATQLRITLGTAKVDRPIHKYLGQVDYKHMCGITNLDTRLTKVHVAAKRDEKKLHVRFLPSLNLARWHMVRSKMYHDCMEKKTSQRTAQPIEGPTRKPDIYGACYQDGETLASAFVWWIHDFKERKLYLCKIAVTRQEGLEEPLKLVLRTAAAEAFQWDLREIVSWDPTAQVTSAAMAMVAELGDGARALVEERFESVPCLRWHRSSKNEVVWEERNYDGFC